MLLILRFCVYSLNGLLNTEFHISRVIVIDTETTGLSPFKKHRIIELAAVEVLNGRLTGKTFQTYLNPEGKKSTKNAFSVHRIRDDFLLQAPLFSEAAQEFLDFCHGADELSFYNRDFDLPFIQHELNLKKIPCSLQTQYRTSCLMLDIAIKVNSGKRLRLDSACLRYGIDISQRKQHGALIDAQLAASLYIKFHYSDHKPLNSTPHQKERSIKEIRPIPRAFYDEVGDEYVQLNFCKNPNCENYGIEALNPKLKPDGKPKAQLANDYRFSKSRERRSLMCTLCGSSTVIINNRAFVNEVNRLRREYTIRSICCPDVKFSNSRRKNPCRNTEVNFLEKPERYNLKSAYYIKKGRRTVLGSQKLECRACKQSFQVRIDGELGHTRSDLNASIFLALVNKGVINRIAEQHQTNMALIYQKIEFFYRQCVEFDRWHVEKNINNLNGKELVFSMDRQHYLTNWTNKHDSRPTKVVNTSTVDNESRFVFASTLNFDFLSDSEAIRKDNKKRKDSEKDYWKRKYAQYIFNDGDMESDDVDDQLPLKPPTQGLLVKQTYSLMAHIELMKPFYEAASHVMLFADDDEGFELGISLVLQKQIEQRKIFPVLIRAERNNASQMQDKQAWSEQILQQYGLSTKGLSELPADMKEDEKIKLAQQFWMADAQQKSQLSGSVKSEWLVHPFSNKDRTIQIKPLINIFLPDQFLESSGLSQEEADKLFYTSTQGVDNYFQMIRRRINTLERPITSATNGNRWNGYASYNPKWMVMLLEILRVYNNYVYTDEKKLRNKKRKDKPLTPAQKIGFADKQYTVNEILSFTVASQVLDKKRSKVR